MGRSQKEVIENLNIDMAISFTTRIFSHSTLSIRPQKPSCPRPPCTGRHVRRAWQSTQTTTGNRWASEFSLLHLDTTDVTTFRKHPHQETLRKPYLDDVTPIGETRKCHHKNERSFPLSHIQLSYRKGPMGNL
jgi:hypothetical protein